jgi:hypothetical protein
MCETTFEYSCIFLVANLKPGAAAHRSNVPRALGHWRVNHWSLGVAVSNLTPLPRMFQEFPDIETVFSNQVLFDSSFVLHVDTKFQNFLGH